MARRRFKSNNRVELLESGDVTPTGRALDVLHSLDRPASAKPGFVDRLIHAEIHSMGGKLATFEKSAARLPDVIVLHQQSK